MAHTVAQGDEKYEGREERITKIFPNRQSKPEEI